MKSSMILTLFVASFALPSVSAIAFEDFLNDGPIAPGVLTVTTTPYLGQLDQTYRNPEFSDFIRLNKHIKRCGTSNVKALSGEIVRICVADGPTLTREKLMVRIGNRPIKSYRVLRGNTTWTGVFIFREIRMETYANPSGLNKTFEAKLTFTNESKVKTFSTTIDGLIIKATMH